LLGTKNKNVTLTNTGRNRMKVGVSSSRMDDKWKGQDWRSEAGELTRKVEDFVIGKVGRTTDLGEIEAPALEEVDVEVFKVIVDKNNELKCLKKRYVRFLAKMAKKYKGKQSLPVVIGGLALQPEPTFSDGE
jgi:hypothetical protein